MAHPVVVAIDAVKCWTLIRCPGHAPFRAWQAFGHPELTFSSRDIRDAVLQGDLLIDEARARASVPRHVRAWLHAGKVLQRQEKAVTTMLKKPLTPKMQRLLRAAREQARIYPTRQEDFETAERLVRRELLRARPKDKSYSLTRKGSTLAREVMLTEPTHD